LIVGVEGAEDAGVYRIGDDLALVETTDIITPLVDDPFTFGRIAAANALSDVYAMGGRPITAMNLAFFPSCTLPNSILAAILAGGAHALREAGACLVGGHTVEDDELKFGLAVTGLINPAGVVRNSTAHPGDILVLTKPLGTGVISTAIKAEMVDPDVETEAIRWMTLLNRGAAERMVACGATAATDVTGFGFIGHACEMALAANVTFRIDLGKVPIMRGVSDLITDGMLPAGCYRNREHYQSRVSGITSDRLLPLYDPQTSGGLLIAFTPPDAREFIMRSRAAGAFASLVGEVQPRRGTPLVFV
jgi:selenide, water dikinase